MNPAASLRLAPRPSRCLRRLQILIHSGAALCLLPLPLPWLSLLCLLAAIAFSLAHHLRRIKRPPDWVLQNDLFFFPDGSFGEISPHSRVYLHLVILRLILDGGRGRTWVICADSLDADRFRLLRMRLLHLLSEASPL